jgi:hypothetical protein
VDERAKDLIRCGDELFSKRQPLLSLWQTIAEQFYVERAEFTVVRSIGEEFADHLNDSYPLIIRRELGDFLSTLRRKDQEWFQVSVERDNMLDNAGKRFLDYATTVQRRAMYDRRTQFTRAMKEADHDFVTFGQPVLTIEANYTTNTLLYQCWHLRDCVWRFTLDGRIAEVHRKWCPTARQLSQLFKNKPGASLHSNVVTQLEKNPYQEIECRHIVVSVEDYEPEKRRQTQTYTELYVDVQNQHVIYEAPLRNPKYVIPRWKTLSGTQYAHSPAVTVGLPDARLIQAMSLTLLEAGEMAVRPPMAAKIDVIPDGAKLFAGGITGIDAEYDGRIEDAIAPIMNDSRALTFGHEMIKDKQAMLAQAFYIQKINLPQFDHEMTAFEFSQRLQEYIRNVIPLFEPIDSEYHAQVCDQSFQVLLENNAFGDPRMFPRSVRGQETVFQFDSPLSQAVEREKGQRFLEAKGLVTEAITFDQSCAAMVDWKTALRDALDGKRTPAKWLNSEAQVSAYAKQLEQQKAMQQQIAMIQQGSEAAEQVGVAQQAIAAA